MNGLLTKVTFGLKEQTQNNLEVLYDYSIELPVLVT